MPSDAGAKSRCILVVGCGSIGKRHIANLLAMKAGRILAHDTRADRRDEVAARFGVDVVHDITDAWRRTVNVALIAVPNNLHIPVALAAAKQGCHLFIEKPLSNSLKGVEELIRITKDLKLTTLVGCNMRFNPGILSIKKLINEGKIGNVVAARIEVGQYLPDWHPWEDYRQGYSANQALGGGIILDAIHEIDYARWILGEIRTVACFAARLSHLEIDTEDTAAITVRFDNGAIGEIHMDYVQRAASRSCKIIGDQGTIIWDNSVDEVRWFSARTNVWQVLPYPPGWQLNQMYLDEMQHFINCIKGREESALVVNEATQVLKIALAAKESALTGRTIDIG